MESLSVVVSVGHVGECPLTRSYSKTSTESKELGNQRLWCRATDIGSSKTTLALSTIVPEVVVPISSSG